MGWFGFGGSSQTEVAPLPALSDDRSGELLLHKDDSTASSESTSSSMSSPDTLQATPSPVYSTPTLALDQIKQAGVPLNRQMSPYLQMDPSIFRSTQPQYIMPEGNEHGKGKFEFALGHIGAAVGGGFFVGCARGFLPELVNPETRQLGGKPWMTRLVNATVKHGSGYAQPAGTAVFLYSVFEIFLKSVRAEDDLNSLAAGALAGALYRSPHGFPAIAKGGGAGLCLATLWVILNPDSRARMREMFQMA